MPLITISRNKGCGGHDIAKAVADGLNLILYDDEKLRKEALKMGATIDDLKGFDTKAPGFFDRILSHEPELYLKIMESVIYEVAKMRRGVIVGHGSQILLRDFGCALHVHICGSIETRINHMIKQQGLSREAARKLISKSDHKRRGFMRFAFHVDWTDQSLYDIVINRDKLHSETVVKLIMEAAKSKEIKECGIKAAEAMEKLSLKKRVEAEILKNHLNNNLLHIEIPQGGVVRIWGYTETQEEMTKLKKIIEEIPTVSKVEYDISVMPIDGD